MKFITYICAVFILFVTATTSCFAETPTGAAANSDAYINYAHVYEASDLKAGRSFAIPGDMTFPGTPGYFGEATPGHNFTPVSKLIMFSSWWDVQSAKNMLKGRTGTKDVLIRSLVANANTKPADKIFVTIAKPETDDISPVAFATVASSGQMSISADVFATLIVKASEKGANCVMFLAEGVNRRVVSWGVGVGFNHTNADLKGGGNGSSGVSTGGTGWSYGQAGTVDRPWLQSVFLNVPSLKPPVVK